MGLVLFAADKGYLDDVELKKIQSFEAALLAYFNSENKALMDAINDSGDLNDDIAAQLAAGLDTFKTTQTW